MGNKCYSVAFKEMRDISPKAVVIKCHDGTSDVFPKSTIFGYDNERDNAVWIAAWILDKKSITFSRKKERMFGDDGKEQDSVEVYHHIPKKKEPIHNNIIKELER